MKRLFVAVALVLAVVLVAGAALVAALRRRAERRRRRRAGPTPVTRRRRPRPTRPPSPALGVVLRPAPRVVRLPRRRPVRAADRARSTTAHPSGATDRDPGAQGPGADPRSRHRLAGDQPRWAGRARHVVRRAGRAGLRPAAARPLRHRGLRPARHRRQLAGRLPERRRPRPLPRRPTRSRPRRARSRRLRVTQHQLATRLQPALRCPGVPHLDGRGGQGHGHPPRRARRAAP